MRSPARCRFSQGESPMVHQERAQILEMVASGEMTVEHAEQRLEGLESHSGAVAEKRPDQRQRAAGFTSIFSAAHIAAPKDYEVDTGYIQALRAAGQSDLGVKQRMALKNYAVDADYMLARQAAGFVDRTVKQLIALKQLG